MRRRDGRIKSNVLGRVVVGLGGSIVRSVYLLSVSSATRTTQGSRTYAKHGVLDGFRLDQAIAEQVVDQRSVAGARGAPGHFARSSAPACDAATRSDQSFHTLTELKTHRRKGARLESRGWGILDVDKMWRHDEVGVPKEAMASILRTCLLAYRSVRAPYSS